MIAGWGVPTIPWFGSTPGRMDSRLFRKIQTFRSEAFSMASRPSLSGCARPTVPPKKSRTCCGQLSPSSIGSFKRPKNRAWPSASAPSPDRKPVCRRSISPSYYRARYYDVQGGRFLSEDPQAFGGGINFYAYTHSSPINLVDPFGLQDNASPWQVGWEWLSGTGKRTHHFSDGDPFTELLRQHQNIRDLIKAVCAGEVRPQGRFDYKLNGIQGVPKYLKDYSTLSSGGLTGNLAVTYLGSYGLSYSESNGVLNIHVWNDSTISSATHPPVLGYTNWWNQHIGDPLDSLFTSGPMSKTSQSFDFHENLNDRCGCKN